MKRKLFLLLTVAAMLIALLPQTTLAQDGEFDWRRFEGSEITLLISEHPVTDGVRSVLDQFEADTGIDVNIEALAEDLYFDRMEIALRAEDGVRLHNPYAFGEEQPGLHGVEQVAVGKVEVQSIVDSEYRTCPLCFPPSLVLISVWCGFA